MTTKQIAYNAIMEIRCCATQYPELRQDRNIAEIIGITKSTFSRIATGVTNPTTEVFKRLLNLHSKIVGMRKTIQLITKWVE